MSTKTKIALAAVLVAATSSVALATEERSVAKRGRPIQSRASETQHTIIQEILQCPLCRDEPLPR